MNRYSDEKKNNLELALVDEVTGDNLKDLLTEGAEVTLDTFLAEGVLKEIPFFGTLYKLSRAAFGIRESIFAKKVYTFLTELKSIPQKRREEFIKKLECNNEYKHKVGEKLLILIEQLDDMEKPAIVGKLLKAAINEEISYGDFFRLSSIVQKSFLPDLKKLKINSNDSSIDQIAKEHLNALGIMSVKLEENRRDMRRQKIQSNSNHQTIPLLQFKRNGLAIKLIKFGLN